MTDPTISTIICSLYGDKDAVPPRPDVPDTVRCVLVTDSVLETPGWDKVFLPSNLHPRLAAKHPKCKPWLYTDDNIVMWMDASCRFIGGNTFSWLNWHTTAMAQNNDNLVQFSHPWRNDILDEANASVGMLKYDGLPVVEQAEHYLNDGHPRHWGLWASGLCVWDLSGILQREQAKAYGNSWYDECATWSIQDQISQPVCIRKNRIKVHDLDGPLHGNGMIEWLNHKSQD